MIIASILLTEGNYYVDDRGQLPHRPAYDKELLKGLVSLSKVTQCGYDMLPESMQEVAQVSNLEPSMAISIEEIDAFADLLIVSRSTRQTHGGKKFRLDKFRCLAKPGQIEIWIRKRLIG